MTTSPPSLVLRMLCRDGKGLDLFSLQQLLGALPAAPLVTAVGQSSAPAGVQPPLGPAQVCLGSAALA